MHCHLWPLVRFVFLASSLALLSLYSWFALGHLSAAYAAPPTSTEVTLNACGSTIAVRFVGDAESRDALLRWINRAATAVCTYYGAFPVPHLTLVVHTRGDPGVHHGVTYPRNGGFITISVGSQTRVMQLDEDWMLTHEMIHLAFPSMAEEHHWIEEGISVYVEPVARVQAGQLSTAQMWSDVMRDLPQGEPGHDDRGLDRTHTWARTYWGGALFCLVADVQIRERTNNQRGLQDALRGILQAGGTITRDWDIERALVAGDQATGTTVLEDLYREMRDKPAPVDLPALWTKLGLRRNDDGSIEFLRGAPLANVREAITRPTPISNENR
jgi:hypothetical protein